MANRLHVCSHRGPRAALGGALLLGLLGCPRKQEVVPPPLPPGVTTWPSARGSGPGGPAASTGASREEVEAAKTTDPGFNASAPVLPDPEMTPGDTLDVTKEDICTPGYAKKVRNVPSGVKRKVYEAYGISSRKPGEYEVDHLISLQLGGSNSTRNLWPQSFHTHPWNAAVKDQLENKLHQMICTDRIDMKQAQAEIASDWIAAYKKYVNPTPLEPSRRSGRSGRSHTGGADFTLDADGDSE